jgi:hypothetical protein
MRFTSALFALAQLAVLAACAVSPRDNSVSDRPGIEADERVEQSATPPTPAPRTYRPGIGIVESAAVVSLSSTASAAAGGTAGAATSPTMAYRLKMADGTTQDVVQTGERFQVGDRVRMISDGRLIRP